MSKFKPLLAPICKSQQRGLIGSQCHQGNQYRHWGAMKGFMRYVSIMNQGVMYEANEVTMFVHGQHGLCGQHDVHINICFQVCIRQCIMDITPGVHNGFHNGSRVHYDK